MLSKKMFITIKVMIIQVSINIDQHLSFYNVSAKGNPNAIALNYNVCVNDQLAKSVRFINLLSNPRTHINQKGSFFKKYRIIFFLSADEVMKLNMFSVIFSHLALFNKIL